MVGRAFALAAVAAVATSTVAADKSADRFQFSELETKEFQDESGMTVHSTTYLSLPMDLKPGEMVFTQSDQTPLQMPKAGLDGYAILSFSGEIVKEVVGVGNVSAPLSECYDHHWIAVQDGFDNPFCGGSPNYVVGIGAESRNTADIFPQGYGYHVKPEQNKWGANIHLLHTVGLEGDKFEAAKECNECYYAPNKGPECTKANNGTFQCCGDNCPNNECFCPTAADAGQDATRFFLRYQVNYTYAVTEVKHMNIGVLTAPDCQLYYAVYEDNEHPETLTTTEWTAPKDLEVVFAVGHQHTGALNISLALNEEIVCTSYPRYGTTEGLAGDEYGYLVEMSRCIDLDTTGSVKVKKGDKVRLESWYYVGSNDTRIYPHPGGTHLNVMAYMYIAYV